MYRPWPRTPGPVRLVSSGDFAMRRNHWLLVVLLSFAAFGGNLASAQEKAKLETPAAQKEAILKEFIKAQITYLKRLQGAAGFAEQGKIFRESNPQPAFAERLLELAKKHPQDPAAYAGLTWIMQTSEFGPAADPVYARAIHLLATQFAQHKDSEFLFERMATSPFASSGQFLQA